MTIKFMSSIFFIQINNNSLEIGKDDSLRPHHNQIDNFHIKTGRLIKIDSLSPNPTCFRVALMVAYTGTDDIRDYMLVVHNKYGKSEGIVTLQVGLSCNSVLSVQLIIHFNRNKQKKGQLSIIHCSSDCIFINSISHCIGHYYWYHLITTQTVKIIIRIILIIIYNIVYE